MVQCLIETYVATFINILTPFHNHFNLNQIINNKMFLTARESGRGAGRCRGERRRGASEGEHRGRGRRRHRRRAETTRRRGGTKERRETAQCIRGQ